MTIPQYQFPAADQSSNANGGDARVIHRGDLSARNGLDSVPHRSDTVTAIRGISLPSQGIQGENMLDIRLLNINQVCAALNMGRVKVYELINRKRLKSVKIGTRRLVSTRALNDFINRLEEDDVAPR